MNGFAAMLAQAEERAVGLTTGGAIMMTLSIGLVLALCLFCAVRILQEQKPAEHHHAPLDIDTHDREP